MKKWKADGNYRMMGLTAFFVVAASMLFYFLLFRTKTLGKGLRRWNATRNIKRPTETIIDNKIGKRRTAELLEEGKKLAELIAAKKAVREEGTERLRRILMQRYDRDVIDVLATINPYSGRVFISARLRKKE